MISLHGPRFQVVRLHRVGEPGGKIRDDARAISLAFSPAFVDMIRRRVPGDRP
jgi:hypothetical protein